MKLFSSYTTAVVAIICAVNLQTFAQNAPAEKVSAQIKRVATSTNPMVGNLSKNLFKTEQFQAPYTVQVPYQDTETYIVEVPYQATESYIVEVPYQDTESYTVDVPYQDTETYTENVPYTVEVPYQDYETEYRQEYKCEPVTHYRQHCHYEQQCYLVPGTGGQQCRDVQECGVNALGQQICKTRNVCEGSGGGSEQRCENKQVCRDVPYTDQNCNYVQVPYTRTVTKYRTETQYRQETRTRSVTRYRQETRTRTVTKTRTETRTREVTKYRSETRTREVTKYRSEEKCCETKTRQVFDRQLQYTVNVVFPQQAQLQGNESETINIALVSADINTAQVQIQVVNSIYGYKIANQSTTGANIQVELALAPKYDLTNAGTTTIQNLKIDYIAATQKFQVSFVDAIVSSRIQSSYAIKVTDIATGNLIEDAVVAQLANGLFGAALATNIDPQSKIKATLYVKRAGVLIAGSEITFETSVNFEKRSLQKEDLAGLADRKNLTSVLADTGADSALLITDSTSEFTDVTTSYSIYLDLVKGSVATPLNMKTYTCEQLKALGFKVKLADVLQNASSAKSALQKGQKLNFSVRAVRSGTSNLLGGKKFNLSATGSIIIQ